MVLLCKQKALYVKCCVIANGITDSQGDTLYAEDIKRIYTSFNNQDNFETNHDEIPIQEISFIENYICTADEMIGTSIVPKGSWMAVVRVDNPEIKQKLLTNEFQGVSLNNRIADACKANLTGLVRYSDIANAECVIPLYLSFVKAGANGYGLHVMDYEAYIQKSKDIVKNKGVKNMAFDLLGGLKKLVQQAEADTEPRIVKEAPQKEEEVVEETQTTQEEPVVKKEDTTESEEKKEEEEEKAEITKEDEETADDDFEAKVTAIVEKILAEKLEAQKEDEANTGDEKKTKEDEDTPKITKSKVIQTNEDESKLQNNTNYFEMTGRDPLTGLPKQ